MVPVSSSSAHGTRKQSTDGDVGPKPPTDGSLLRRYKGVASDLLTRGWKKMNKGTNGNGGRMG